MHSALFEFIEQYMVLTPEEKQAIAELQVFRTYKKGTVLLEEGKYSPETYFVLKGMIRVYYLIEGEERTTAFYTEMEGLTPVCTVTKAPSEYYIACVEDCILTVSNDEMEQELFEKFPRFESLCRVLSERLLAKNRAQFDHFKTASPEQRYLQLVEERPELIQRAPLNQLASFLGITPESLSRIRKRIQVQGK
jgi:CRP-like cAMP-binding protein